MKAIFAGTVGSVFGISIAHLFRVVFELQFGWFFIGLAFSIFFTYLLMETLDR
jgi:hypothetical protein